MANTVHMHKFWKGPTLGLCLQDLHIYSISNKILPSVRNMKLSSQFSRSWNYRHKKIPEWRIEDSKFSSATILLCLCYCNIFSLLIRQIDSTSSGHRNLQNSVAYVRSNVHLRNYVRLYKNRAKEVMVTLKVSTDVFTLSFLATTEEAVLHI